VSEQNGAPNETARIEAFSDGVFAIAITLLILEIQVPPQTPHGALRGALLNLWPSYLAFLASFMTIGVMWLNHHRSFTLISILPCRLRCGTDVDRHSETKRLGLNGLRTKRSHRVTLWS
jgi:uncharacterized membrane protein